ESETAKSAASGARLKKTRRKPDRTFHHLKTESPSLSGANLQSEADEKRLPRIPRSFRPALSS
ncbi:MAG: hypothetical protein MR399_00630, partial [Clostridiales bacterium]|nr:hypothetical protein [Clostridiales bacterium]